MLYVTYIQYLVIHSKSQEVNMYISFLFIELQIETASTGFVA